VSARYLGSFAGHADLIEQFDGCEVGSEPPDVRDEEVLFAAYSTPPYEGYAQVLFERDGVLYEVEAAHCSCHGLEGQWRPGVVTWEALALRPRGKNAYAHDDVPGAAEAFWALVDSRVRR
jgi:hypothetical protein